MSTIVIGPFVSVLGGAEIVKLGIAEFFSKRGWRVVLAGLAENNFARIRKLINIENTGKTMEYSLFKYFPGIFGLYQPVIGFKAVEKIIEKLRPDVVFIDYEGSRGINHLWRKKGFKLIKYVHFPQSVHLFIRRDPGKIPPEYLIDLAGYFRKYSGSVFWKTYLATYVALLEKNLPENPVESDLLLTNSTYIGKLVKALYGVEPIVLHPPVDISDLVKYAGRSFDERDDAVVMLGRISSEKNYEEVINAISLTRSKPSLRIIGSLSGAGKNISRK